MNVYETETSAAFFRTREQFGELSNMADISLEAPEGYFHTSEALYQALKFDPAQRAIIGGREVSPFREVSKTTTGKDAKRVAYLFDCVRGDWNDIRFDVMNYVIRWKYFSNRVLIDAILDSTMGLSIVEKSYKDDFWGAIPDRVGGYRGCNALGELWMFLREERPNVSAPEKTW